MKSYTLKLVSAICLSLILSSLLFADETNYPHLSFKESFGTGKWGYLDGTLEEAQFNRPQGMIITESGAILVADTYNHCIRKIIRNSAVEEGQVTTFLGKCGVEGSGLEHLCEATENSNIILYKPTDILEKGNSIFVLDSGNNRLLEVSGNSTREINTTDFCESFTDNCEIDDNKCNLKLPTAMTLIDNGLIFIADTGNHRIISVDSDQVINLVAGTGKAGYDPEKRNAGESPLDTPTAIVPYYNSSNLAALFVVDSGNGLIRQLRPGESVDWLMSTIAGSDNFSTMLENTHTAQLFKLEKPYLMISKSNNGRNPLMISQPTKQRILGLTPTREIYIAYQGENLAIPYAMAINANTDELWLFDSSGMLKVFDIE